MIDKFHVITKQRVAGRPLIFLKCTIKYSGIGFLKRKKKTAPIKCETQIFYEELSPLEILAQN